MQYRDINKIFSGAVAKTLSEGYTICTNTMSGTQGEIAFVNFIDDNGDHYSLMLDKEIGHWDENEIGLDRYVISWVRSTDLKGYPQRTGVTFWRGNKYVEVISQRIFYIVSDKYFVEDAADAKRIWETRKKHYRTNNEDKYRQSYEIPMSAKTRKLVALLWKANKSRSQKTFKQVDINSAKICRCDNERRLCINGSNDWVSIR